MQSYLHLSGKYHKLLSDSSRITDVGGVIETGGFRLLENMKAVSLAVSGSRKVACVVSDIVVDVDVMLNTS